MLPPFLILLIFQIIFKCCEPDRIYRSRIYRRTGYQFLDFESLNIVILFTLGWITVMHQVAPPL